MRINDKLQVDGSVGTRLGTIGVLNSAGPIGTAAATVDIFQYMNISAGVANLIFSIPNPTAPVGSLFLTIQNFSLIPYRINAGGILTLLAQNTHANFRWAGSSWLPMSYHAISSISESGNQVGIGVAGNGSAGARFKVGAAALSSKLNIEYSAATPALGEAGIALYHAANGVAVSTRIQLWNTNTVSARMEFTNGSYSGPGGGNRFVFAAPSTSNGIALVTNEVVRMTISNLGIVNFPGLPIFDTDAAAGVGGLLVGDLYRATSGVLSVKL